MDESHRLLPMKGTYDEKLFNQLYKETQGLRKKLAHQIDARKFGVDYDEILSWFDVKFLFAFNKYFDREPERLKGYLVNALMMYKYRIMRSSYQVKYHNHANMLDVSELVSLGEFDVVDEVSMDNKNNLKEEAFSFLKSRLCNDALLVLEIELNPPDFIIMEMEELYKPKGTKIPNNIIADYLGYGDSDKGTKYIGDLRKDIKEAISLAQSHFKYINV